MAKKTAKPLDFKQLWKIQTQVNRLVKKLGGTNDMGESLVCAKVYSPRLHEYFHFNPIAKPKSGRIEDATPEEILYYERALTANFGIANDMLKNYFRQREWKITNQLCRDEIVAAIPRFFRHAAKAKQEQTLGAFFSWINERDKNGDRKLRWITPNMDISTLFLHIVDSAKEYETARPEISKDEFCRLENYLIVRKVAIGTR